MAWDDCFTVRDYDRYMGYDQPDLEVEGPQDESWLVMMPAFEESEEEMVNGIVQSGAGILPPAAPDHRLNGKSPSVIQDADTGNGSRILPKIQLYRKIHEVYKTVTYVQRDKRNSFHGYNYASETAIKEALHGAFVEHGLILLPPRMTELRDEIREADGKKTYLTTAKIIFAIADIETGETVEGEVYGRGVDPADKGIYKSITGALKYCLTTAFLIPTGDDPEKEETQPEEQRGTRQARQPRASSTERRPQPIPVPPAASPNPPAEPLPALPSAATAPAKPKSREMSPTVDPARQQWFSLNRAERIQSFRDLERSMPPDPYYQTMERHGVGNPTQFKSANAAWGCFQELAALADDYRRKAANPETFEHHQVHEGEIAS